MKRGILACHRRSCACSRSQAIFRAASDKRVSSKDKARAVRRAAEVRGSAVKDDREGDEPKTKKLLAFFDGARPPNARVQARSPLAVEKENPQASHRKRARADKRGGIGQARERRVGLRSRTGARPERRHAVVGEGRGANRRGGSVREPRPAPNPRAVGMAPRQQEVDGEQQGRETGSVWNGC